MNAGAVIADSIERFAPEAWKTATADEVYRFVRDEVRQRANEFLAQRGDGLSVDAALERVTAGGGAAPIGLSFGEAA